MLGLVIWSTACGNANEPTDENLLAQTDLIEETPTPLPTNTPFPTPLGPTPLPTNTPAPTPTAIPAWFEGVFIQMPEDLAVLNPAETIEEQLGSHLPADQRYPRHDQFVLDNWPIESLAEQPRILAFAAKDYASINVNAQREIDQLKSLIDAPDLLVDQNKLPFLPVKTIPQALKSQVEPLPFRSGDGLRYVTWYPDQLSTSESPNLVYTWQGLTADGRAVVSAIFPITAPGLPAAPTSDSLAAFDQWAAEITTHLDQLAPTEFQPRLDDLDQLVGSIYAQLPEPELKFDTNGKVDLTIVYPRDGGETTVGRQLLVEGYVQPGLEKEVELLLLSGNNSIAAETVLSQLDGWWETVLDIPINIQGEMHLTAVSEGQTAQISLSLVDDPISLGEAIQLSRPLANETIVAGYPVYFEGFVVSPLVDDTLTVGVFVDGCQTLVAKQSLILLPEDTRWHSQLQIPAELNGSGCLAVWTGAYGEPGWREIQVPITIASQPPQMPQVALGNPHHRPLLTGQPFSLYGTAFGAPDSTLLVSVYTNDGELITESELPIGEDRLWEVTLTLPEETTGRIFIETRLNGVESFNNISSLPVQSP